VNQESNSKVIIREAWDSIHQQKQKCLAYLFYEAKMEGESDSSPRAAIARTPSLNYSTPSLVYNSFFTQQENATSAQRSRTLPHSSTPLPHSSTTPFFYTQQEVATPAKRLRTLPHSTTPHPVRAIQRQENNKNAPAIFCDWDRG
jgi:hypothetical protein